MAHIFVAYNMHNTSEFSPAFKTVEAANNYADTQEDSDDWDVCMINHPTMSQEQMIQTHELIMSDTDNVLPN